MVLGLGMVLASIGVVPTMAAAQPALPSEISGSSVIQLPPCNGQATADCTLSQSWSASLLSPDQAAAVYVALGEASGSFSTCGMIAFYQSDLTSASLLPGGLQAESVLFYGGHQLVSPELSGYPGTGSTPYVHYSTADGCGTYGSGVTTSTTTTSQSSAATTGSATSTATVTTTSTSSSINTTNPGPYGGHRAPDYALALLGSVSTLGGALVVVRGRFP